MPSVPMDSAGSDYTFLSWVSKKHGFACIPDSDSGPPTGILEWLLIFRDGEWTSKNKQVDYGITDWTSVDGKIVFTWNGPRGRHSGKLQSGLVNNIWMNGKIFSSLPVLANGDPYPWDGQPYISGAAMQVIDDIRYLMMAVSTTAYHSYFFRLTFKKLLDPSPEDWTFLGEYFDADYRPQLNKYDFPDNLGVHDDIAWFFNQSGTKADWTCLHMHTPGFWTDINDVESAIITAAIGTSSVVFTPEIVGSKTLNISTIVGDPETVTEDPVEYFVATSKRRTDTTPNTGPIYQESGVLQSFDHFQIDKTLEDLDADNFQLFLDKFPLIEAPRFLESGGKTYYRQTIGGSRYWIVDNWYWTIDPHRSGNDEPDPGFPNPGTPSNPVWEKVDDIIETCPDGLKRKRRKWQSVLTVETNSYEDPLGSPVTDTIEHRIADFGNSHEYWEIHLFKRRIRSGNTTTTKTATYAGQFLRAADYKDDSQWRFLEAIDPARNSYELNIDSWSSATWLARFSGVDPYNKYFSSGSSDHYYAPGDWYYTRIPYNHFTNDRPWLYSCLADPDELDQIIDSEGGGGSESGSADIGYIYQIGAFNFPAYDSVGTATQVMNPDSQSVRDGTIFTNELYYTDLRHNVFSYLHRQDSQNSGNAARNIELLEDDPTPTVLLNYTFSNSSAQWGTESNGDFILPPTPAADSDDGNAASDFSGHLFISIKPLLEDVDNSAEHHKTYSYLSLGDPAALTNLTGNNPRFYPIGVL